MAEDKKRVKRRDKKNISNGVAHVNSTFNNTMITTVSYTHLTLPTILRV